MLIPKPSLFLTRAGTSLSAVMHETGLRSWCGWKAILFFFTSVSLQPPPFPSPACCMIILVQEGASGLGACFLQQQCRWSTTQRSWAPWTAVSEVRSVSPGSPWEHLCSFLRGIIEVVRQESTALCPYSMPGSPGERKVGEPTPNKEGFRAMWHMSIAAWEMLAGGALTTLCWGCWRTHAKFTCRD